MFGRVYFMHAVFWKSIFYACSILEEYMLCMQYFRRVYFMHAVLWKSIFYAYSILEEYMHKIYSSKVLHA
jgi:hypothetical protein